MALISNHHPLLLAQNKNQTLTAEYPGFILFKDYKSTIPLLANRGLIINVVLRGINQKMAFQIIKKQGSLLKVKTGKLGLVASLKEK